MIASVLTLLWRNVASVRELTRILEQEGFLWVEATKVSQKALSNRFLEFPAILFQEVLKELLPNLQKRWIARQKRPLSDSVKEKTLLLIDRGFYHFQFWQDLIERKVDFITRIKKGASYQIKEIFTSSYNIRDSLIVMGNQLSLPMDSISLEMIYRGFYHFIVAYNQGKARDIIKYFAQNNKILGIVKQERKPNRKLIIAPFPERQKSDPNFFFENPLTFCFSP
jgi:hypothetical protein